MSTSKFSSGIVTTVYLLSLVVTTTASDANSTEYGVGDVHPMKGLVSWVQSPVKPQEYPADYVSRQYYPNYLAGQTPPPPSPGFPPGNILSDTIPNNGAAEPEVIGEDMRDVFTFNRNPQSDSFTSQFYPMNPSTFTSTSDSDYTFSSNEPDSIQSNSGIGQFQSSFSASHSNKLQSTRKRNSLNDFDRASRTKRINSKALAMSSKESTALCGELSSAAFPDGFGGYTQKDMRISPRVALDSFKADIDRRLLNRDITGIPVEKLRPRSFDQKLSIFFITNKEKLMSPSLIYILDVSAEDKSIVPHFFYWRIWLPM
ncbi:hypothetical protein BJ085DRAFT_32290 [Dimargaris cristalligena]|uniref:Uncharacterized protein n=1 Tax=Dimargaris cristalligena TaxID=215637 RepID=A0A4P9ZMG1_9FUNG|nr:hypothetical protein BJ085DRAFT_32290 [Dimargaris cristalligena]|eukprot:RKP33470.1 hypothetical protein BJ085DRAFT_32290 [Dimargaris cristalligena]